MKSDGIWKYNEICNYKLKKWQKEKYNEDNQYIRKFNQPEWNGYLTIRKSSIYKP